MSIVFGACVSLAGMGFALPAEAATLYFEKAIVKTSSEATCLKFASDVARSEAFRNVHKSNSEVAGEKDGSYVARQVGRVVADRIKGVVCFDTPC